MLEQNFNEKEELNKRIEQRLEVEKQLEKGSEFLTEKEKIEKEKIQEKIKKVAFQPTEEEEAKKEVTSIKSMALPGKIDRLFEIANEKGLFFALKIAENTGDGYLIDIFHDLLVKDGTYKKYLK
jgi:phage head maturation protease